MLRLSKTTDANSSKNPEVASDQMVTLVASVCSEQSARVYAPGWLRSTPPQEPRRGEAAMKMWWTGSRAWAQGRDRCRVSGRLLPISW